MIVAAVPNPREWRLWNEAEALLEPARARGDSPSVLDPDDALFAVMDGDELLAVATAWRNVERHYVEVRFIGGKDHRRWLEQLDEEVGARARAAGATRLIGIGRLGWGKAL